MWSILSAEVREEIVYSLVSCEQFTEEQKGYHETRGTGDLQYIDHHILKESKVKQKNVAMAWIDNKNACDIIPQSWR